MARPQPITERVLYRGTFQGMGLATTAQWLSHDRALTGFARPKFDGSVELVVHGPENSIQDFLEAIHLMYLKDIDAADRCRIDPKEQFPAFEIRY